MQLRNQNGKQRDWKVVAAVTAASAIGLSGLALANPGNGSGAPDSIQLRDRTEITQVTTAVTTPGGTTFNTVLSASADTTNDSPFTDTDTASFGTDSPSGETMSESVSPSSDMMTDDSDSISALDDTASESASTSFDSSFDS